MKEKNIRVIIDTNVFISFLIGKKMVFVKDLFDTSQFTIITTQQLFDELIEVTNRDKIKKYFPENNVKELLILLKTISSIVQIIPKHFINRDPKDNFLLDLIDISKADYLITGDKDLIALNPFKTAKILTPSDFEIEMKTFIFN
jgi:putative PIN family toxin of toxin-antitoxin system